MKANADLLSPASTLIAVDWGSTNFRASLVVDGDVVDHLESPDGIRHRNGRDYDDLLHALVGHWRAARGEADVVMSGMVGSREGWVEVRPYWAPDEPIRVCADSSLMPGDGATPFTYPQ